ncbi:MAG: HlyD family secretion protein, partial [Pirellulaceae bacterium]|nr:HlyD family secretion protein [Pirellulaceae bacterium]
MNTTRVNRSFPHRSMASVRGGRTFLVVLVLLAVGALIGGYILWVNPANEQGDLAKFNVILSEVTQEPFLKTVLEKGELVNANNTQVKSKVKSRGRNGGIEIIGVHIQDGDFVKEGDLLITLDSSPLEEELERQVISVSVKEASVTQAKNNLAAARISKDEYLKGVFTEQKKKIENEIILAKENLRRAKEYAKYSEGLAAKGYVTALQLEG